MKHTLSSLLLISSLAGAKESQPKWITEGKLSDESHYYVVCSHDGLVPEEVRQIAEGKCLVSAAKLGGATVTIRQKTVQSLTGSDSAETAEIQPITQTVKCIWTDRFMEQIQNGVRIWLRCQVDRRSIRSQASTLDDPKREESGAPVTPVKYKRATLNLISVPVADRVLVLSGDQERSVIEVKSNVERIELREGDTTVVVRKQKYIDYKLELGDWPNGSSLNKTIYLNKEF